MAHANKATRSINGYGASVCVDIFVRPDGTFGFEEYRRDFEDREGWFPTGHYSSMRFRTEAAAFEAAAFAITWLTEAAARGGASAR